MCTWINVLNVKRTSEWVHWLKWCLKWDPGGFMLCFSGLWWAMTVLFYQLRALGKWQKHDSVQSSKRQVMRSGSWISCSSLPIDCESNLSTSPTIYSSHADPQPISILPCTTVDRVPLLLLSYPTIASLGSPYFHSSCFQSALDRCSLASVTGTCMFLSGPWHIWPSTHMFIFCFSH